MFLVHITSFNPCRQDTAPLAPSFIRQPICGPKPINSHYGKGPRLSTAAQHPLSSKLDGALSPLCLPSTKAVTKSQSHALAGLGSPWQSFRLGPRAVCKPFATLAQISSQPFRAVPTGAQESLPLSNSCLPLVLLQEETCFLCIQA